MDRRSTISGSSSLSSHTRDEFKDLTSYYRNYFAGRKGESQDAAMEKSNIYTKALKMLGFGYQQLINWVKQKDATVPGDPDFSGKELWSKLVHLEKSRGGDLGLGRFSKSDLCKLTIRYVREKATASKQQATIDVVDLEEESDQDQATNDFHDYFTRVLGQRIRQNNPGLNAIATNSVIEHVRKVVVETVGFQPVSLLALYGCDLERMKNSKDPRKPPPQSRIRDILSLYFDNSSVTATLPNTCPLGLLMDILVDYCGQSAFKDRFTSDDARNKYKEAYKRLPSQHASPAYAVSCIFLII